ncbi:MAG: hypothetical protein V2A72_05370 [Candidatus Omnitrophota bacterium]
MSTKHFKSSVLLAAGILLTGIIFFTYSISSAGLFDRGAKKNETKAAVKVEKKAAKEEKKALTEEEKKQELITQARAQLANTVWKVTLRESLANAAPETKRNEEEDTIYFEDRKVRTDKLTKEGFLSSNYTVRIKGNDFNVIIWETMQTSEKSGVAFLRGDINCKVEEMATTTTPMRGVLSWHIDDKVIKDYTFTSKEKSAYVPPPVVEEPVPVPAAAAPAVVVETPAVVEVASPVEVSAVTETPAAVTEAPAVAAEAAATAVVTETPAAPVKEEVKEQPKEEKKKKRGWF